MNELRPDSLPDQPTSASTGSDASVPPPEKAPPADRLAEFGRTLAGLTPRVYVTPALVWINVLIFVLMTASGAHPLNPTVPDLLRWGANFGPKTITGEWSAIPGESE